ncbi:MAG: MFS transporter [Bacteroidales bacterium]|nr:MFS transporter [Bacteroidales bacterium]
MDNQKFGKLAFKEKFGYSLGDAAANLAWRPLMAFLPIFYTDTFGLPLASVGLLLALTRSFDGITDVIMGSICDRTNTRWGKFRPYLLWTAVPFGLLLALTFTTPNMGPSGKLIWAYTTYALLTLAYTANNVPYSSLSGVMSGSIRERTNISSYRFFGAYLGGFISIGLLPYLVTWFGKVFAPEGSVDEVADAFGYQYSFYLLAVLLVVFSLIAFKSTRERIKPSKRQKSDFIAEVKELVKNKPWVIILLVGFLWVTYNSIRQGAAAYYFKWVYGDKDLVGTFFIGVILASMASTFIAPALTNFFGKKRLFIMVMIVSGIFTTMLYWVPSQNIVMFFTLGILAELAAGIMPILFFAMLGDTADYSEFVNKRRATGLTFSAGTFAMKFGGGMAGVAMMFILSSYNYKQSAEKETEIISTPVEEIISIDVDTVVNNTITLKKKVLPVENKQADVIVQPGTITERNVDLTLQKKIQYTKRYKDLIKTKPLQQDPKAIRGIRIINSFLPVIFIILAIIMILFYPLTTEKMYEVEAELKSRKEKEELE